MLELGLYETVQACGRRLRGKKELNAFEKAVRKITPFLSLFFEMRKPIVYQDRLGTKHRKR